MERLLITGSSGTIGTELARRYTEHDPICIDTRPNPWLESVETIPHDLTQPGYFDSDAGIDVIVHLAANARVHELVKQPGGAKDNIDAAFNALEIARHHDAEFIFSSSREVYGDRAPGDPVSEEDVDHTITESPYTASKLAVESLIHSYERCYGLDATILRFSNVYGRYDVSNRVVPLFIARAAYGRDLTVYGTEKTLDFTHLDDCVDGLQLAIETPSARGETYNIASGEGHSIQELAFLVRDAINPNINVSVEDNRTGEIGWFVADTSKAEDELGYTPGVSFEDGVFHAINWYQSRQHLYDEILA